MRGHRHLVGAGGAGLCAAHRPERPLLRGLLVLRLVLLVALVALFVGCGKKPDASDSASLSFAHDGTAIKSLTKKQLTDVIAVETVTMVDPYYGKQKTFRALPLKKVLDVGFEGAGLSLDKEEYVLRATDGYTVPFRASRLLEDGAYVAIEDADVVGWEPIGNQKANPGPFYLVWKKPEQQNLETHARPWQLATIEIAPFDKVFPHTSPGALPAGSPALAGYATFRDQCVQCHAINREGGRVGPDLNVPQNVLEYRPEAQVRAYIKNPLTFRYGNMPPHPGLTDADLDGLIAYLSAMKDHKFDPDGKDKPK